MRVLMIICGVIAGLVLAVGLSELVTRRGAPPDAQLISDAHGRLSDICIQYRKDFSPSVIETLVDLFNGLSDEVKIKIIVEQRTDFEFLNSELASRGVTRLGRLKAVITGFPITPWARDRFGAMTAGGRTIIAAPPMRSKIPGPRGNDELVPELLTASLPGAICMPLPFMFEGGDLLADADNAFIAANCLARNSPLDVDDRPSLLERIGGALRKKIVVIGKTSEDVPDHHICMYLTPLGENRVVVADPALGLELYRQSDTGAAIDVETDISKYEPFQKVIHCMELKGFNVVRVPFLLTRTPRVYVSYNNAILERRNGNKLIYMPVYGIPALDRAAGEVFENQGWQVIPVRVSRLYGHTGSLRCQVGIIKRK
ncbi:MAG: agmatine deiminase family protein [bacterium]